MQPGWDLLRATSPATASFCLLTVPGMISGDRQPGKPCGWTAKERFLLALLLWSLLASPSKGWEQGRSKSCLALKDGGTRGRAIVMGKGAAQGKDSIFNPHHYLPNELQARSLANLSQSLTRQGTL